MKRLILLPVLCLLFLASCSEPPPPAPLPLPIPILYDNALHDGSVVFWEGGLLVKPIVRHTGSDITHATVVLYNGSVPYVYEAVPPCVHKLPLAEYRLEMAEKVGRRGDSRWFIMPPKESVYADPTQGHEDLAESQLGRKYMLRGWWKGQKSAASSALSSPGTC